MAVLLRVFLGVVLLGGFVNVRASAPGRAGAPLGEQLVGRWSLVSLERVSDTGTEYPLGRDALGYIQYDAGGHMSVQIMRRARPDFASGDQANGTAEEITAAFQGYIAYYGTYHVDESQRTVTHRLEGSLFPNWNGTAQVRHITMQGNQLTLSTPPILFDGTERVFRVIWKKVE